MAEWMIVPGLVLLWVLAYYAYALPGSREVKATVVHFSTEYGNSWDGPGRRIPEVEYVVNDKRHREELKINSGLGYRVGDPVMLRVTRHGDPVSLIPLIPPPSAP